MAESETRENGHETYDDEGVHDPHFEPIITLPKVDIKTLEEDEEILFKIRAKLFRLDHTNDPHEWKERGVGDVKILQHKHTRQIRILMRREKVLKLCANHLILPEMELVANIGSDRAWVWNTLSDYSDEQPQPEVLAIRFANSENAQKFKEHFDRARNVMKDILKQPEGSATDSKDNKTASEDDCQAGGESTDPVTDSLNTMTLTDKASQQESSDARGDTGDGQINGTPDAKDDLPSSTNDQKR